MPTQGTRTPLLRQSKPVAPRKMQSRGTSGGCERQRFPSEFQSVPVPAVGFVSFLRVHGGLPSSPHDEAFLF